MVLAKILLIPVFFFMINFFQPEVTFVINYLIQCTVWKTGIVSKRLRNSRKTAFHCISIRVFNWNSEWLTATSWKSNNGWASCYWGRINFAIIWSRRKVNGSFYSPTCRTTIMTKSDPTATWKAYIKENLSLKFCSCFWSANPQRVW